MGKTSERLEAYQTQMSIYAEQHKLILASDVLDMIEQLQDDLKDDIEKVVEQLEEMKKMEVDMIGGYCQSTISKAIEIVKAGGKGD